MSSVVQDPIGSVAHYTLLERLEPAGLGELYRARDTRLGRTVAVRLLPADFAPDPASRATLLETARPLIARSHPNIIALFDAGEHDGRVFIVFEYLEGRSLRAEMAGRPMNMRRGVELAIQMADALADAHANGSVHGGLSPESIVVTAKGRAKIPTFELAARGGFDQQATDWRLRDYDSPEEARGQPADERSDIYSIGAVLYEMLTGRRPLHRGASARSASNRHVPDELDEVVLKAVAPNPNSRAQNAATLAAELRGVAARLDVGGDAGDEGEPLAAGAANVGRVLLMTAIILLALGAAVWAEGRYPAGFGARISPSRSANADRASTWSIPAARAAVMTSVCTCDTYPSVSMCFRSGSAFSAVTTSSGRSFALLRSRITSEGFCSRMVGRTFSGERSK